MASEGLRANPGVKGSQSGESKVMLQSPCPHLIMHQCVQPLPVALDLGGDVLVLQHDPGYPALTPLWVEGVV